MVEQFIFFDSSILFAVRYDLLLCRLFLLRLICCTVSGVFCINVLIFLLAYSESKK